MEIRVVNRCAASFKQIAAQVADRDGVRMATFIGERGLNDFLIDHSGNTDVADFAAHALLAFCVEDGRFNGFIVGLKTVLQFLGEHLQAPALGTGMKRSLGDLHQVLGSQPTLDSIKQWINSHYG
jgi:hypothetical protein